MSKPGNARRWLTTKRVSTQENHEVVSSDLTTHVKNHPVVWLLTTAITAFTGAFPVMAFIDTRYGFETISAADKKEFEKAKLDLAAANETIDSLAAEAAILKNELADRTSSGAIVKPPLVNAGDAAVASDHAPVPCFDLHSIYPIGSAESQSILIVIDKASVRSSEISKEILPPASNQTRQNIPAKNCRRPCTRERASSVDNILPPPR